jgi:hypothetical protein
MGSVLDLSGRQFRAAKENRIVGRLQPHADSAIAVEPPP